MPATSDRQRRFMGAALAAKRGERAASPAVAKAARSMSEKSLRDFAKKPKRGRKSGRGKRH